LRKLYVPLAEADRERLSRLARADDRHPSDQAKRLLTRAIRAEDRRLARRPAEEPAGRASDEDRR
jgi:hypothetical protein